jgi:hypothetical protein
VPPQRKSVAEKMANMTSDNIKSCESTVFNDTLFLNITLIYLVLPMNASSLTCPPKKKGDPAVPLNLVPLLLAQMIQANAIAVR